MALFQEVSIRDGLDVAAKTIEVGRERIGHAVPWSVAELAFDEKDFEFLVKLLRQADENAIKRGLRSQCQAKFGLVFLCFAAEIARRFAGEGEVWSVISKCCNERTRRLLFLANNQPRQDLKDALEVAARCYELRHVFGTSGVQNWYQTIYLQFGFTKKGFSKRLPEWLVGQPAPEAVAALRDDEGLRSQSFRELWCALREYRRNNLSEQSIRERLTKSPWILPAWIDDLMKAARQRMELPDRPTGEFASEIEDLKFLSEPRLDWTNEASRFLSEVTNLAQLDNLTERCYALRTGNRTLANVVRQRDESYEADTEIIALPCAPTLTATLVACDSNKVPYSQIVELWDANDDVTLFNANGKRLDVWNERMAPEKNYYVLAADDLTFIPQMTGHRIAHSWKLYELRAGWSWDLKLTFDDGDTLWTPRIGERRSEPTWTKSFQPEVESVDEKSVKVKLGAQFDISVRFARCGVPFHVENNRCDVPLSAFGMTGTANLRIGLRRGEETCVVERRVSLNDALREPLVLAMSDDGWRKLGGDKISSAAAKRGVYKFFLPKCWDKEDADWVLVEGDVCLGKPPRRPQPIHNLAGFGAKLTLRHQLYNVGEKAVEVSKKVVTCGCVEKHTFDKTSCVLTIHLCQSLEPSDDYKVVAWTQTGLLHSLSVDACGDDSTRWECVVSDDFANPVAVAVAFRGEWMGAWVQRKANEWLPSLLALPHLGHRLKAALLRWFHLPLLSQRYCSDIRKFVETHPVETIAAWLRGTLVELPCGLKFADRDDAWFSVVRAMFQDWRPKPEEASALFEVWMEQSETQKAAIGDAFDALLRVDPRLAVKVIQVGCRQHSEPLRFRIASAGDGPTYQRQKGRLVETCSKEMRCDTAFLKSLLEKAAEDAPSANKRDAVNLATAIVASSDFRKLLAMHLLECVA
jgi:hypothetical protein